MFSNPFLTQIRRRLANGHQLILLSRAYRKGLPPPRLTPSGKLVAENPYTWPWLKFWAPQRLAWWIAFAFLVGSTCFALGAYASNNPGFTFLGLDQAQNINRIFFIGSLFFTTAAGLQLLESINGDIADADPQPTSSRKRWKWIAWKPRNAGYMAAAIQFAGTLLFNLNTASAMIPSLHWFGADLLIWTPDFIGSIFFLLSSYIALIEVSHRFFAFQPQKIEWWIAMLNMLGSIAFMISALSCFFLPQTGESIWGWGANFYTLLGALCFWMGAYLMIPELFGAGRGLTTIKPEQSPPQNLPVTE